jgi:ABC-type ATPase involved in cell division
VLWDEQPVALMGRQMLLDARRSLGYMFQVHALISNLTVFDNVALPLRHHGVGEQETRARVEECMARLGLSTVTRVLPEDLAYGMQRKAALARAIVVAPDMLVLDEPTAGMDPETAQEMVEAIAAFCRQRRPALLVSGTNEGLCRAVAGKRVALAAGRLTAG